MSPTPDPRPASSSRSTRRAQPSRDHGDAHTPALRVTPETGPSRLMAQDADTLRWLLLRWYEGDCGVKSSMGEQLDRAMETKGHGKRDIASWHELVCNETYSRKAYDLSEDYLAAADDLRAAHARWASLDARSREVLRLVYGELRHELPEWGDRGPIVLRLRRAHAAWEREQGRATSPRPIVAWLAKLRTTASSAALRTDLEAEAEAVIRAACRAWERSLVVGEATRRRQYRTRRHHAG